MRLTLSQMLTELSDGVSYSDRAALSANRKVMYLNWAQQRLQQVLNTHVPNGAWLFIGRVTYTLDGSASYALPPNLKNVEYVEFSTDNDSWYRVPSAIVTDRVLQNAYADSTLYPTSGYVRVWFSRRLSPLFSCTLGNAAASSTSATLPAGLTASATGTPSTLDDDYIGATLRTLSGTGSGQESEITDYVGSTLAATVAFSDNVDNTTVAELRCDFPEDHIQTVILRALRFVVPKDRDLRANCEEAEQLLIEDMHGRQRHDALFGHGDDSRYDDAASVQYLLWGSTIRFTGT